MEHTTAARDVFHTIVDRWLPLIFKGSMQYAVPGRTDTDDLVQESLVTLLDTIQEWLSNGRDFESDLFEFEKYFKTVFFHRLVDSKRYEQSQKRNVRREVHPTEDYDPMAFVNENPNTSPESRVIASNIYDVLKSRLTEDHAAVLEAWLNPDEGLLEQLRRRTLRCINQKKETYDCGIEYTTSGVEDSCPNCGSDTVLVKSYSPSKIHQYDLQEFLQLKRVRVMEAMSAIRSQAKSLNLPLESLNLSTLLELVGFGSYVQEDQTSGTHEIKVASCRYSEGTPTFEPLIYHHLKMILSDDEMEIVNFCVVHNSPYYQDLKFSDIARRLKMSIHKVRQLVDGIRIKIELIDIGVPLKDIPRS